VSNFSNVLAAKRVELLHQLAPAAQVLAFLVNPDNPNTVTDTRDVQQAAHALGLQIVILNARNEQDLDQAFAALIHQQISELIVAADPFFIDQRELLTALAAQHAIPTIYNQREFVEVGGLMSYGTSLPDAYRQAGIYTGRILNGAKPADLPVLQPTKFEFVINLKTAKALRLEIPPKLIALADEVIE
jgi:putative ABC transport system substrate-binding protein